MKTTTAKAPLSGMARNGFAAVLLLTALAACGAPAQTSAEMSTEKTLLSETLSVFLTIPQDLSSITHQGAMGLALFPAGIPTLETNTLSLTSEIRNSDGEVIGITSELEDFSVAGEFVEGAVWETYWTLLIEGRGAIFLHEQEKLDPVFAGILVETKQTGEDWVGTHNIETNYGPHPSGHGVIIGGTGEFAGITGTFQEIGIFTGLTADGGLSGTVELRLALQR